MCCWGLFRFWLQPLVPSTKESRDACVQSLLRPTEVTRLGGRDTMCIALYDPRAEPALPWGSTM
jgi:hypothetical protein